VHSITAKEAREWCSQAGSYLNVTDDDCLEYKNQHETKFLVRTPPEHRRIVALAHDILMFPGAGFEGGLLWLQQWEIGVTELARPGWRIIEDIRRAHGDLRSLDIAPAQLFRNDEFVELHASLIQVLAYGWSGYLVPSVGGYFLDLRTSDRFFCNAKSPDVFEPLFSALKDWGPLKETSG
jgi:hypothetical protein